MQTPQSADGPMLMPKEPVMQVSRADFARLLSGRAQHLLERMADEIERDEAKSALGRLLADEIANEHDGEAEAVRTSDAGIYAKFKNFFCSSMAEPVSAPAA